MPAAIEASSEMSPWMQKKLWDRGLGLARLSCAETLHPFAGEWLAPAVFGGVRSKRSTQQLFYDCRTDPTGGAGDKGMEAFNGEEAHFFATLD